MNDRKPRDPQAIILSRRNQEAWAAFRLGMDYAYLRNAIHEHRHRNTEMSAQDLGTDAGHYIRSAHIYHDAIDWMET